MRITEEQLRISIRQILNEAEGVKVQKPAATQKTPQFVLPPRLTNDEWIECGSQQSVQDAKTFKFKDWLEKVQSMFQLAKEGRIDYITKDYVKRYKELADKLKVAPKIKPEVMRDIMIARLKGTKILIPAYPSVIKSSSCTQTPVDLGGGKTTQGYLFEPHKYKDGAWSKFAREAFRDLSEGIFAFASRDYNIIAVRPPSLMFDANMKLLYSDVNRESLFLETHSHELIHQETYAITEKLGLTSDNQIADENLPASLAKQLLSRSMISEEMLTVPYIKSLLSKDVGFKDCIETQLELYRAEPEFRDLRIITWLAMFCKGVDPTYDADLVIDNYIETQPDEKTREMLFEVQIIKDEIKARVADLTSPDHIRETLTYITTNIRGKTEISEMGFFDDEVNRRGAVVVAVTNPELLQDLTLVAVNEPSKQGAQGTGSRLAERWTRLAGI